MITNETDMKTEATEGTDLYTATEAMLNFPIRPCRTTNAHSLQLGVSQLPVHLHAGLKRHDTDFMSAKLQRTELTVIYSD